VTTGVGRRGWLDRAACRDFPTEMFFPVNDKDAEPAKAVCWQCPVRRDCLAYALADPHLAGVWGATTEDERGARRRQLRQAG